MNNECYLTSILVMILTFCDFIHSYFLFVSLPLLLCYVMFLPVLRTLRRAACWGGSSMFIKEISVEQSAVPGVVQYAMVIWTTPGEACSRMNYCTWQCCTVSLSVFGHEWKGEESTGCKHRSSDAPSPFIPSPFTSLSVLCHFCPQTACLVQCNGFQ